MGVMPPTPKGPSEAAASSELKGGTPKNSLNNDSTTNDSMDATVTEEEEKELLLCFRPLEEGEKVGEDLRFSRNMSDIKHTDDCEEMSSSGDMKAPGVSTQSSSSNDDGTGKDASSPSLNAPSSTENQTAATTSATAKSTHTPSKNRPPKKRMFVSDPEDGNQSHKKIRGSNIREQQNNGTSQVNSSVPDEKSVVESLMLMSNNTRL